MGANTWRDEDEWPLARTSWTDYYISSRGNANTKDGDGELVRSPSTASPVSHDTLIYDPVDPVPFITAPTSSQIGGPDDYSVIEDRGDVLVYSTSRLDHDVEATGPVRAVLFVSSSAVDTDFVARLIDRHPRWFLPTHLRWGRAYPLPRRKVPGSADGARRGVRSRGRPVEHVPCISGWAPDQARGHVKRVPKVRPQHQHRRGSCHCDCHSCCGEPRLARSGVPFQAGTTSGSLEVRPLLVRTTC